VGVKRVIAKILRKNKESSQLALSFVSAEVWRSPCPRLWRSQSSGSSETFFWWPQELSYRRDADDEGDHPIHRRGHRGRPHRVRVAGRSDFPRRGADAD